MVTLQEIKYLYMEAMSKVLLVSYGGPIEENWGLFTHQEATQWCDAIALRLGEMIPRKMASLEPRIKVGHVTFRNNNNKEHFFYFNFKLYELNKNNTEKNYDLEGKVYYYIQDVTSRTELVFVKDFFDIEGRQISLNQLPESIQKIAKPIFTLFYKEVDEFLGFPDVSGDWWVNEHGEPQRIVYKGETVPPQPGWERWPFEDTLKR